jgi:hypothetical protein
MGVWTFQTLPKAKQKKSADIKVHWVRFPKDAAASLNTALKRPLAFAIVGGTGGGKSALVELIASKYEKVVDLFGSRDNEGLAWLRSGLYDKVLFLKGASAVIDCNCAEVINATDLTLKDLNAYDVIISCSSFYAAMQEEWYAVTKIMEKLWHKSHWKKPYCLAIREASSLVYSRLSVGETQGMAKSYLIYVIREMRHCGFAVALDTIRWYGVDIDLRSIADYTFIKAQGIDGLPASLRFLYRYFQPSGIMRCPVNAFAIVSRKGPIGFGTSICPPWHKQEHENLLDEFDIKISYRELPNIPESKMAKVGDYEHVRIIKSRLEMKGKRKDQPIGMDELAQKLGRSSATVFKHISVHNNMVHGVGECDKCARVGCEHAKVAIN